MTKKLRENEDFNRLFRGAAVFPLVSSYSLVSGQRVKCVVAGLRDDHTALVVRFKDIWKEAWFERHFEIWNLDHDGTRITNVVEG